jgi:hypothetical protein
MAVYLPQTVSDPFLSQLGVPSESRYFQGSFSSGEMGTEGKESCSEEAFVQRVWRGTYKEGEKNERMSSNKWFSCFAYHTLGRV